MSKISLYIKLRPAVEVIRRTDLSQELINFIKESWRTSTK